MLTAARRRLAVLASVLLLGLVAAGCGEVRAQTQWSQDRTHGVSATAGDIGIRNALVVADEDGRRATVLALFANTGEPDELVSVQVAGSDAEPADLIDRLLAIEVSALCDADKTLPVVEPAIRARLEPASNLMTVRELALRAAAGWAALSLAGKCARSFWRRTRLARQRRDITVPTGAVIRSAICS